MQRARPTPIAYLTPKCCHTKQLANSCPFSGAEQVDAAWQKAVEQENAARLQQEQEAKAAELQRGREAKARELAEAEDEAYRQEAIAEYARRRRDWVGRGKYWAGHRWWDFKNYVRVRYRRVKDGVRAEE